MKIVLEIETRDGSSLQEAQKLINSLLGVPSETKPEVATKPVETKKAETKVKPKATPKKAAEKPVEKKEDAPKEEGITLANLKDRAKDVAQTAGREKVKECISNYAPKLTEVSKEDFGKLYLALGKL